ncbi:MAG: phage Gp37/Gp68 family protein [Bacteroidales bacterium]|nr:phage Gp37/Gp68 family protein [Bacteroidales bacterium]
MNKNRAQRIASLIFFNNPLKLFDEVKENPRHRFMFLTKNPKRYLELQFHHFPENAWLGTTVNSNTDKSRIECLSGLPESVKKYVSVEPLLGLCNEMNFSNMDMVIVGAMTGHGAIVPQKEWVQSINADNIFWKDNIKKYL